MAKDVKIAGMNGPIRSPMTDNMFHKGTLHPSIGANTTIPGTAPKAAPIRSPLQGQPLAKLKGGK